MVYKGPSFGGVKKNNGAIGNKGITALAKQGIQGQEQIDAWKTEYGITADSKAKDYQNAFGKTKAGNVAPNNISGEVYNPEISPVINKDIAPIMGTAGQISEAGKQLLGEGNQTINSGVGTLKGILGTGLNEYGDRAAIEGQARGGFQSQTQGAIDPRFSQAGQQFLDQGANQRLADINSLYGEGGPARSQLAKDLAYNVADLDQLGVGGTTEAATIGNTLTNFQNNRLGALQQANELSRQEAVGERGRVASENSTAAGRSLSDALAQGQMQGNLLGLGKDIGTGLTSAGSNQQAIAAELSKLGLTGSLGGLAEGRAQQGQDYEIDQGTDAYNKSIQQQRIDNARIAEDRKRLQELEKQLQSQYGIGG